MVANWNRFDGKNIGPPYQPAPYDGEEPKADIENGVVYHGSCHCGAVKVAVKTKGPLDKTYDERCMECNCSICQRVCYVFSLPPPSSPLPILSPSHPPLLTTHTNTTKHRAATSGSTPPTPPKSLLVLPRATTYPGTNASDSSCKSPFARHAASP